MPAVADGRQARHDCRMRRIEEALRLGDPDAGTEEGEESKLVVGQWQYYGRDHWPR